MQAMTVLLHSQDTLLFGAEMLPASMALDMFGGMGNG